MVRISEKVPGKEDSVVAIKMVFGTRDQSKPIRDLLRRHGVFSRKESSANLGLCGLTSAPLATPVTQCSGFTSLVS